MKPALELERSPVQRLRQYWEEGEAPSLSPPAPPAEVRALELSKGVALPNDFRNYLEQINGFDQQRTYQDERGFNFWPLEKLTTVADCDDPSFGFVGDAGYIMFCDYLDLSWVYALSARPGAHQVVLLGTRDGQPKVVADSFSQFVDRYLADDARLYP